MHRKLRQKKKVQSSVVYPSQVEFDSLSFLLHHSCLPFFVCLFFSLISFLQFLCTFYLVQLDFVNFSFSFLALKVTKVQLTAFSLSNIPSGILFHFCISSWSRCVTCAGVIFQSAFLKNFYFVIFCILLYFIFSFFFSFWRDFQVTSEMSSCQCNKI